MCLLIPLEGVGALDVIRSVHRRLSSRLQSISCVEEAVQPESQQGIYPWYSRQPLIHSTPQMFSTLVSIDTPATGPRKYLSRNEALTEFVCPILAWRSAARRLNLILMPGRLTSRCWRRVTGCHDYFIAISRKILRLSSESQHMKVSSIQFIAVVPGYIWLSLCLMLWSLVFNLVAPSISTHHRIPLQSQLSQPK